MHAKATTQHPAAQELQSCISPTQERGLSATHVTPGSATDPMCDWWPSFGSNYLGECLPGPVIPPSLQDPIYLFHSSPSATDLSLLTHDSIPSALLSNPTHNEWDQTCSGILSAPETRVNNSLEAGPLLAADDAYPKQTDGVGLYDFLPQTYTYPISCLAGFPHTATDFCHLPWTATNDLSMGGGEHFPTLQQDAVSDSAAVPRPEAECERLPFHESWITQQRGSAPIPDCLDWTDTEIPAQTSDNWDLLSQPLGQDGVCHNEAPPHDSRVSRKDLVVPSPRQRSQTPQPEVLTVSEHSQDTGQECTCGTESPNTCLSCVNSLQAWVMVTYKLVKPSSNGTLEKRPPKPRRRLEEAARRQTCQTRKYGACVRCKIQRVRVLMARPTRTRRTEADRDLVYSQQRGSFWAL